MAPCGARLGTKAMRTPILCKRRNLTPDKPKELLSCHSHEPQVSPHPYLDVTGAPDSPHGVQILVAAGEYHTHGLVAFPDLGHGFLIHKLSLALVFHSLKVQTPMEEHNRAGRRRRAGAFSGLGES